MFHGMAIKMYKPNASKAHTAESQSILEDIFKGADYGKADMVKFNVVLCSDI